MAKLGFSKNIRLVKNQQFRSVLWGKCFSKNDLIILYALRNDLDFSRFGVSVGRKYGNAVQRNRLKRLAREAFRISQGELSKGWDFVLIYTAKMTKKDNISSLKMEQVRAGLVELAENVTKRCKK